MSQQQESNEVVLKQKAIEYFQQKQYEKTLSSLKSLLERYPKDPELNYYSGVSLTEIGRDLNKAVEQLRLASLSRGPQEVYFFLGKALYKNNNYSESLKYFERYRKVGPRENQRNLKLDQWLQKAKEDAGDILPTKVPGRWVEPYIEQISDVFYQKKEVKKILDNKDIQKLSELDKMNQVPNHSMKDAWKLEKERDQQTLAANAAKSKIENKRAIKKVEKLGQTIKEEKTMAFENFQAINDGKYMVYDQNIEKILLDSTTASYSKIKQFRKNASINYDKAMTLRKKGNGLTDPEKKFDILGLANAHELLALDNQKKAIGTYAGLVIEHKDLPSDANPPLYRAEVESHNEQIPPEKKVTKSEVPEKLRFSEKEKVNKIAETIPSNPANQSTKPETERKTVPPIIHKESQVIRPASKKTGTKNQFTILPTPEYNKTLSIVLDEPMPMGTFYKIQIGVFKNLKTHAYFKGIQPISAESIESKGTIRFFGGLFSKYELSRAALREVKRLGFKDAFIVAFRDGKKISVKRARVLESTTFPTETSGKPIGFSEKSPAGEQKPYYKIQIGVFSKPINSALYQTFKSYAGEKDLDLEKKANGIMVYTIGNFINFESATFFKEDLVKKGLKDAFIRAYRGEKKIPISQALKAEGGNN